jgi:hypothetical protein
VASRRIAVCLDGTPKQTFASALDWPGRRLGVGRDESAALEALASYAERYAPWRWVWFTSTVAFDVVERVPAPRGSRPRSPYPNAAALPGGIDAVIGQRAP